MSSVAIAGAESYSNEERQNLLAALVLHLCPGVVMSLVFVAVAGSYFFQPRGRPHGFRVEAGGPARILYATLPARMDRFIVGPELLASRSEAMTTAARNKMEILGPLIEGLGNA